MLHLCSDTGCDVAAQFIRGALEAVDHLLELRDDGVSRVQLSLLSALHVALELLDVWKIDGSAL